MARESYELRVGFFGLGALMLTLYGLGWLKSFSFFEPPQTFWVRFHDVAGLSNNATINVQGVRVGTVQKISFSLPEGLTDAPDASPGEAKLPKVYTEFKITGLKKAIPSNADITIQTLGLVGAKYIEITLPDSAEAAQAIDPRVVIAGNDPVRVELVVNNLAKKLNQAAAAISSDEAVATIKNVSEAAKKLNKSMDNIPELTKSLKNTSDKIGKAADRAETVASSASSFFVAGKTSLNSVNSLATGLSSTNNKVSKILDNPNISKDLKETVELAHKTALSVQKAVSELNSSVKDKDLRQDLLAMLSKIQNSSEDIKQSMQVVNKLADDQGLRSDVKEVVKDAKEAMNKANNMISDPGFKVDIKQTMGKVKTAAGEIDVAARQLQQILGKRAPLFHMMFGKPGELREEKNNESLQDGTSVNKTTGGFH